MPRSLSQFSPCCPLCHSPTLPRRAKHLMSCNLPESDVVVGDLGLDGWTLESFRLLLLLGLANKCGCGREMIRPTAGEKSSLSILFCEASSPRRIIVHPFLRSLAHHRPNPWATHNAGVDKVKPPTRPDFQFPHSKSTPDLTLAEDGSKGSRICPPHRSLTFLG